jgi:hypothetical protein
VGVDDQLLQVDRRVHAAGALAQLQVEVGARGLGAAAAEGADDLAGTIL